LLDESGFQLKPAARRIYARRGGTTTEQARHRKGRTSAISAVAVSLRRRRPRLVSPVAEPWPEDARG
jgi:hypothetical protein